MRLIDPGPDADVENSPENITLTVGSAHVLELPGLGTAGYRWSHTIDGDPEVITVSWQRGVPAGAAESTPIGLSHQELVTIYAAHPGTVTMQLSQQRAWETEKPPLHRRTLTVHVISEPAASAR